MGDKYNTRHNMKVPYVSRDKTIVLEFTESRAVGLQQPNDRLEGQLSYVMDNKPAVTEAFTAEWKEQNRVYRVRSKSVDAHVGPRDLIEVNIGPNATKAILYNRPGQPHVHRPPMPLSAKPGPNTHPHILLPPPAELPPPTVLPPPVEKHPLMNVKVGSLLELRTKFWSEKEKQIKITKRKIRINEKIRKNEVVRIKFSEQVQNSKLLYGKIMFDEKTLVSSLSFAIHNPPFPLWHTIAEIHHVEHNKIAGHYRKTYYDSKNNERPEKREGNLVEIVVL